MTSDDDVPDRPAVPCRDGTVPAASVPVVAPPGVPRPAAVRPAVPSRPGLLVAVVLVVAAGLAASRLVPGLLGDALGDALYAVLVLLLVTVVAPRRGLAARAVAALAFCWAIELAQLTGGPEAAVRAWFPLRYLLGATFAWGDLVAYAVGVLVGVLACVLVAAALMRVASVRSSGHRRPATTRP